MSILALPGVHSRPRGALTTYPPKLGPNFLFLALGCTCTHCTLWLRPC